MTQEAKKALITRWIVAAAFMAGLDRAPRLSTGGRYHSNVSGLHYFLDMHDTSMVRAQREDTTTLENVKQALFKGADQNEVWGRT